MTHPTLQDNTFFKNSYYVTLFEGSPMPELAEIQEVEMEGWMLLECFLLADASTIFLSWDNDASIPEPIGADEFPHRDFLPELIQALIKKHQPDATI